jgi:hypothetical protein
MIVVRDLRMTCQAAPSLWEGRVGEHGSISIRYRCGGLLVRVSSESGDPMDGAVIYDGAIGDDPGERTGNSCCGEDEMNVALAGLCVFE